MALALQGGGALGAFTWGVLDRLLEDGATFESISGASSGAVNALLVTSGLQHGGPEEARARLERFWRRASDKAANPLAVTTFRSGLALFPRVFSPYQFNPLGLNPLREMLAEEIDFETIAGADIALLIAATRVRDGALRIFRNHELTVDAVLASAALPMVHHAIEIENEWYWDGGYSANPPLLPLVLESSPRDVLVVQIVPTESDALPRTPREINGRLTQITFNRSLMSELETITELSQRSEQADGALARKLQQLCLHTIRAEDSFANLADANALNLDWNFLVRLRDAGRAAAENWLNSSRGATGARQSAVLD
ncbi:MAG: patatin-like phospholipase family protein [Variibacter sp.]